MKRLIIFLLLSIGVVTFSMGQTTPMAVFGDVYVSGTGSMVSKGPVHVKAGESNYRQGRIDNNGTLKLDEGIIFYSNDSTDGLLQNKATVTVGSGKTVTVRKSFAIHDGSYFYTFSFPFNVGMQGGNISTSYLHSKILKPDGNEAQLWTDYAVAYYSSEKRVATGKNKDLWAWWNEDTLSVPGNYLKAGQGHRYFSTHPTLDFVLTNPDSITALFNYHDKIKPVIYYWDPALHANGNEPSEGWNILGGLNTTSFRLERATVDYTSTLTPYVTPGNGEAGALYYWNNQTPAGWTWIYLGNPSNSIVLSPYVTFFVQTGSDQNFLFHKEGLSLDKADPSGFRSTEAQSVVPTKDMLCLSFYKNDNLELKSETYVEMKDTYNEEFKVGEDYTAEMAGEENVIPRVWSWYIGAEKETYQFFVNRLPLTVGEIQLGVRTPSAGDYTFELDPLQRIWIKEAVLVDKIKNEETDLLSRTYSFNSDAANNDTKRFILRFTLSKTPMGVEEIANTRDVFAYSKDNILWVKNLNKGDQVRVLDLSGRTIVLGVASSEEFSAGLSQKGVYLVNVKGEKNVVLKVMNK